MDCWLGSSPLCFRQLTSVNNCINTEGCEAYLTIHKPKFKTARSSKYKLPIVIKTKLVFEFSSELVVFIYFLRVFF